MGRERASISTTTKLSAMKPPLTQAAIARSHCCAISWFAGHAVTMQPHACTHATNQRTPQSCARMLCVLMQASHPKQASHPCKQACGHPMQASPRTVRVRGHVATRRERPSPAGRQRPPRPLPPPPSPIQTPRPDHPRRSRRARRTAAGPPPGQSGPAPGLSGWCASGKS